MIASSDPANIPFNDWLKNNGVWVAVAVASVILIVIAILFIVSKTKKD